MAWFIVSDVAGRLLEKLAQWNDEGLITHIGDTYFGERDKLEQFEETLRMIQAEFVAAERRQFRFMLRGFFKRASHDFQEMVKALKQVLYRMEELIEEVAIVEAQRDDQQSSAGWNYKLIKSLCMSHSKSSLFRAKVKQISESMVKQVDAVMQQWRYHNDGRRRPRPVYCDQLRRRPRHDKRQSTPELIQCIAYCSLFPKAYEFKKADLINLWMAQGYLDQPSNTNNQTPQQVGHRYFLDLVSMGVFQDGTRNQIGDVISFKMDCYWHKQAIEMARAECRLEDGESEHLINTNSFIHLHHVSFIIGSSWQAPEWLLDAKQLRSLLLFPMSESISPFTIKQNVRELLVNLKCLRALHLGRADLESVLQAADYIGRLKHLRYLNFGSSLESIPESIIRLRYLQTLDLQASCPSIMKLPHNFCKNVKLMFSTEKKYQILVDESNGVNRLIASIQAFGKLDIFFKIHRRGAVSEASATDLKNKEVNDLVLEWSSLYQIPDAHADKDQEDVILKNLKPPSSLKTLVVCFWRGTKFPSWEPSRYVNLPNLVSIEVVGCDKCRYLPLFSRLPSLRYLRLADLKALEYIEVIDIGDEAGSTAYFPSLKILKLEELPELMGWSKGTRHQAFCQLSELEICVCPKMMSLPHTSTLDSICVQEIHGGLLIHISSISTFSANSKRLKRLQIDSVQQLSSLSVNLVPEGCLIIKSCEDLISIEISSLTNGKLEVYNCSRLRDFYGQFGVDNLKICGCDELKLWDFSEDKSSSWKVTKSLRLGCMTKLKSIPMDIGNLAGGIRRLYLFQLPNFRGLSDWLSTLKSLNQLDIVECLNLTTLFDPDCGVKILSQHCLKLNIERCRGLVDISFKDDKTKIDTLRVCRCDRLKVISGKKLVIEELQVDGCLELALWDDNGFREGSGSSAAACVGSAAPAWKLFSTVKTLRLKRSSKLEYLPKDLAYLRKLKVLTISKLPNLRQLPEWIRHSSKLNELEIEDCPNLRMLFETTPVAEEEILFETTAWQHLREVVRLQLKRISKMESLPEGIACLTELMYLKIYKLEDLSELPEWIGQMSELESLEIEDCPKLTTLPRSLWRIPFLNKLSIRGCSPELMSRCQEPTGEYWPRLKYFPELELD